MQIVDHLEATPRPPEGCVITIGNFDGVHLGHRALIRTLEREADRIGASVALVTFEPHTLEAVRPDLAPQLLTSTARKTELLAETGVDYLTIVTFDADRAHQPAEDFVKEILVDRLHAREVMVGEDFHFGHRARGDISLLERMGTDLGFGVSPVHLVAGPDGPYSSTSTRRLVASGDVEAAALALGRPHEVRGVVVHGDERGRTIGFPTANVVPGPKVCVPAVGVYAGRVRVVGDGDPARWHDAVVNFGVRPTFRGDPGSVATPLVEAHLFDFDGDLYDSEVDVGFVARLRDERRFDGVAELRDQIEDDARAARARL